MDRTQFTFYVSFWDALKRIKKKQDRCEAYDAIVAYALFGTEPDLDKLPDAASMAFILAKPTLDASRRKAENGSKKKQTGSKTEQSESKDEAKQSKTEANEERERVREREREREGDRDRDRDRERMFSIKKEAKKESAAQETANSVFAKFAGEDHALLEALTGFAEMRKTIKKPLTVRAANMVCEKLGSFHDEEWVAILNQSTMNCWQGLFPLDEDRQDKSGRTTPVPAGVSKKVAQTNAQCQKHNTISPGMMEAARKMLEEDV